MKPQLLIPTCVLFQWDLCGKFAKTLYGTTCATCTINSHSTEKKDYLLTCSPFLAHPLQGQSRCKASRSLKGRGNVSNGWAHQQQLRDNNQDCQNYTPTFAFLKILGWWIKQLILEIPKYFRWSVLMRFAWPITLVGLQ